MDKYIVTGMSCAACQARVEKAVSKVEGVSSCSVSLLTNSMGVDGSAAEVDIIKAVEDAGYGCRPENKSGAGKNASDEKATDAAADTETIKLRNRLIASIVFLCILMYFSMGHMMWGWPIPSWFHGNHVAIGLVQLLLATIIMVINQKFFISGFKGLFHGAPNMDSLVALGSGASYIYSVWMLLLMTKAVAEGGAEAGMAYMDEFYFESAAMILALITVGKMLESRSKGKTTDALKGLMKLAPKTATVIKEGREQKVGIEEVVKGDIIVVRPGESIPVDGIVLEGNSAVNEAALTGESIPVDKEPGNTVSAATINQSGFIKCKATRVGEDTTLSQIIKMVSDAAATKAPIAKIADKVSGIFVPVVIGIAAVTFAVWMLLGAEIGYALARAISVLVISCPCALGLATPVAIMVGSGVGAKNGTLFKTAAALENTGRIQIVALDKTGTITSGKPSVTDVISLDASEDELVRIAYLLEKKSEHPLGRAVVEYADNLIGGKRKEEPEVTEFEALAGRGLKGSIEGRSFLAGNRRLLEETSAGAGQELYAKAEALADEGKTPLYFIENTADGYKLLGMIAVADTIKPDAKAAVDYLKELGLKVVMLTGDNERTAKAIGKLAGVDEVVAEVLPDGKESVIRRLQAEGKTAMVGDGINDAPALTAADIGIAVGAGTDIAIDAADVVLMKEELSGVPAAVKLGRATLRNIHENLFWAFIYNIIGIPLAAGVYVKLFGWSMNPMYGAAAMSLSSFCVVSNALRLNMVKLYGKRRKEEMVGDKVITDSEGNCTGKGNTIGSDNESDDKSDIKSDIKSDKKGDIIMTKTMIIEGMMCGHCEATVKKTLEAIEGVASAEVSHTEGTAVVNLSADVSDETLKSAVEAKDYSVKEIR